MDIFIEAKPLEQNLKDVKIGQHSGEEESQGVPVLNLNSAMTSLNGIRQVINSKLQTPLSSLKLDQGYKLFLSATYLTGQRL